MLLNICLYLLPKIPKQNETVFIVRHHYLAFDRRHYRFVATIDDYRSSYLGKIYEHENKFNQSDSLNHWFKAKGKRKTTRDCSCGNKTNDLRIFLIIQRRVRCFAPSRCVFRGSESFCHAIMSHQRLAVFIGLQIAGMRRRP